MIEAVLLDVGGTLWSDVSPPVDRDRRARRLADLLGIATATASELAERLDRDICLPSDTRQRTLDEVAAVLADFGLEHCGPSATCRAMCVPAKGSVELFPGVLTLLQTLQSRSVQVAIVTNALWRTGEQYIEDFDSLGAGGFAEVVVSSVDLGYRKPDRRVLEAALEGLGAARSRALVVGNSEENDVAPAIALGMGAVRVAIEEPLPERTEADFVALSLDEVTRFVKGVI